ncbi:MAG: hypothetical protein RI556_12030 [Hydrogenovibrio sp.]|uniref:hypothetical protein n=1 Tax=Hydrogenovibrio sp. TaxID=2065821 RepID=UPI002870B06F|nr:hypothetical protein [Hydrogenovibrio sp.]MDR9499896.1 hypothetical protein [Hydrogenovibrio sp.]
MMTNKTKLALGLSVAMGLTSVAQAATESVNASVTVNNTIDLTVNSALDFGTVSALADTSGATTGVSTLVMPANPATAPTTTTDATSNIVEIVAGAPADLSVVGAAANYELTITLPAGPVTVTDPSGSSDMTFELNDFTRHSYTEGNDQTFGTTTTDVGDLAFYVGATLSTTAAGTTTGENTPYADTTYTASFDVSVDY